MGGGCHRPSPLPYTWCRALRGETPRGCSTKADGVPCCTPRVQCQGIGTPCVLLIKREGSASGVGPLVCTRKPAGSGPRDRQPPCPCDLWSCPGRSLTGKKKVFQNQFSQKSPRALHVLNHGWWRLAVGGWRLAVVGGWRSATGGWWQLVVVGGGWWLVIGGWWQLAVGGWSPLAVGSGWWRLVVGGGWRLMRVGSWRLVIPWGGP